MFVPIRGRPVPEVTWSKDDTNLKTRAHIDTTESYTLLVIPDCTRYDAGKYHLCLENVAGKKTGFVNVKVLDTPGPPVNLKPREITKNSITLQWEIPIIDGGSKIHNYIVEKRAATKKAYTVLSTTWQKCSFKIPDLEEGAYYYFRVSAENDLGVGEPAETPVPIRVSQAPSAPENLYVTDVTCDSASLAWTKPLHDGGSLITGYVIEAQKKDTDQWVHVATIKALDYTVTDLIEGAEYTFRIIAVNASGRSDPRESRPAIIKEQTSAPSFDLRGVYQKTVIAKAGDRLKVEIPVLGKPRPVVSWKKGDTGLKETQRINIETTLTSTILNINEIKRTDGGQYSMTGKNMLGTVSETITVLVHDIPGPPTGPIKLEEVSCDYVLMSWDPPENDGGVPINNYIVEMRETTGTSWVELAATVIQAVIITRSQVTLRWTKPQYDGGIKITGYIIEKKEGAGRWMKASFTNITETEFVVTGLTEDQIYEFRIIAKNAAGVFSQPSDSTGAITAKDEVDPPRIDLEAKYSQAVVVNAGDTFKLEAAVCGKPVPTIHWLKEGQEITEAARLELKNTDFTACLVVKEAIRVDGGQYMLLVKNVGGEKSVNINVKVLDRPGAPEGPISIYGVTSEKCSISWKPPLQDGGSDVSHYIVERRETSRLVWTVVEPKVQTLNLKITKLLPGNEYIFRVVPVNKYGVGEPLESEPMVARNPFVTPNPPTGVEVSTITKDSMVVTWERPTNDGGSPIQGYIVEKRDKDGVRWTRCNKPLETIVTNLLKGEEYQFRVVAVNDKGKSDPRQLAHSVVAKDLVIEPAVRPKVSSYSVQVGYDLKIEVPIAGHPKPIVTWTKDGVALKQTTRVNVTDSAHNTTLTIKDSTRDDAGMYSINVTNALGSKDSITLSWEPPTYTGGCQISNYVVEKRDTTTTNWMVVSATVARTTLKISNLKTGAEYQFRIYAENRYGKSYAIVSEPVVAQYPFQEPGPPGTPFVSSYTKDYMVNSILWTKINKMLIQDCRFKSTPLEEGIEYEYRVYAENIVGIGECSKVSEVYVAHDPCDPPGRPEAVIVTRHSVKLRWMPPEYDGGSLHMAGSNVELKFNIRAKPAPSIEWFKDGRELEPTSQLSFKHTFESTTVFLKETTRLNSGTYEVKVKNSLGSSCGLVRLLIQGIYSKLFFFSLHKMY
uniref:Titin n=1 Tax=Amphilophus citrinellus TaxID=61819 RepID=A0A3Q0QSI2_AMPCI